MYKEIERKFLVSHMGFLDTPGLDHMHIEQAYLAPDALAYEFERVDHGHTLNISLKGDPVRFLLSAHIPEGDHTALGEILYFSDGSPKVVPRLRIFDDKEAVLMLKGRARGLSRDEFEVPLALEAARFAFERAKSRLCKIRYLVPVGDKVFEVDVYEGPLRGLVTAEVEFPDNEDPMALALPDWVGRDVSEDVRYSNVWLAEFGLTSGVDEKPFGHI